MGKVKNIQEIGEELYCKAGKNPTQMHIEFGVLQYLTACEPYSSFFIAKETCFSCPTEKDLFCTHLWR